MKITLRYRARTGEWFGVWRWLEGVAGVTSYTRTAMFGPYPDIASAMEGHQQTHIGPCPLVA